MTHRVESPAHTDDNRPLNTRGPYFGLFLRAMRHGPRDNPWDKQTLSAFTRRNLLVSGRCGNLTGSINGCTCHGKNVCWACPYSLRTADAGIINGNSMNLIASPIHGVRPNSLWKHSRSDRSNDTLNPQPGYSVTKIVVPPKIHKTPPNF